MLYIKVQPQSFLGSGKEDFMFILPYMGMAAIFNGAEPFEQIVNTPEIGPTPTLVKIGRANSKITRFYTLYSLGQGQISAGGQNFDCN